MLDKKYIRIIRTILTKKQISEELKEEMVLEATNNRTSSIREMYTREAIGMIKALNGEKDDFEERKNRMRRKVLAIAHELGWEHADGKVDMTRVNEYCKTRGNAKKNFNWYNMKELQTLIIQFKQMRINYLSNERSPV